MGSRPDPERCAHTFGDSADFGYRPGQKQQQAAAVLQNSSSRSSNVVCPACRCGTKNIKRRDETAAGPQDGSLRETLDTALPPLPKHYVRVSGASMPHALTSRGSVATPAYLLEGLDEAGFQHCRASRVSLRKY